MFGGKEMDNCRKLTYYNVENESTLHLILSVSGSYQIFVKMVHGKTIVLEVQPNDTVLQLKEKIRERDGIPSIHQRLIYGGKQMDDRRTLMDYDLQKEYTLVRFQTKVYGL